MSRRLPSDAPALLGLLGLMFVADVIHAQPASVPLSPEAVQAQEQAAALTPSDVDAFSEACFKNVGEMVRINGLIVALIHEKIGLVLHENSDLSQKLGVFLAHQSVPEKVYASAKGNSGSADPVPGYSTNLPPGLQDTVDVDCTDLRKELREWEEQVTQWSQSKASSPA